MFSFQGLVLFILNLIKKSLQLELNTFARIGGFKSASKQAFSKARRKLSPKVFTLLNEKLIGEFYTDNEIQTFQGFRVLAVDGSNIQLPSSAELLDYYGGSHNHVDKIFPMARSSSLFDILNKITIHAVIEPYKTSEKNMALKHLRILKELNDEQSFKNLLLFDRGYPSMELLIALNMDYTDFVMRCSSSFVTEVNKVAKKESVDQIVDISFSSLSKCCQQKLKSEGLYYSDDKQIKIRVLTFKLKSGEKEILLTSLLNKTKFPPIMILNLYKQRWDIEENYKFHKSIASLENFSGKSTLTVQQDFLATVFTCNIANILIQETQEEVNEVLKNKGLKYKYRVNRNIGLGLLKNELIQVLIANEDINEFCMKIKSQMQKSLVPIRPGRSYPRKKSARRNHPTNRRPCM